jgi:hypothetical protein
VLCEYILQANAGEVSGIHLGGILYLMDGEGSGRGSKNRHLGAERGKCDDSTHPLCTGDAYQTATLIENRWHTVPRKKESRQIVPF